MATSFLLRKSLTIPGAITLTGNTLGLTDIHYIYRFLGPGALFPVTFAYNGNDIGAFVTTDTSKQVSGYPAGTTSNWSQNSSMAVLKMPQGAVVKYAELIWGGSTRSNGSNTTSPQNLDGVINTPVQFTDPTGRTYTITPDPATAAIATVGHVQGSAGGITAPYTGGNEIYYVRSQDVTNIVAQRGAGQYICGGVPANIVPFAPGFTRCCGWDLVVMYELPSLPVRNLDLFLGIDAVGADGVISISYSNGNGTTAIIPGEIKGPREIDISGFVTPATGPVNARILLSGMEGDPRFPNGLGTGDQVRFGPNLANLTLLSGPNNQPNNFLASQINDDAGLLDTSGTFGNLNSDPNNLLTGVAKRDVWDITNLNGMGALPNSQTSAVVTIQSQTDEYALHLLALQIDVNAPMISSVKAVDKQNANVGDVLTYTVVVKNTGAAAANNVVFVDSVPNGTSFVPGSVTVNGAANTTAIPNTPGFSIPDIAPNGVATVTFKVTVTTLPVPNPIPNNATINFTFQQAPGLPVQSGSSTTNTVNTLIKLAPVPSMNTVKSVDKTSAVVGDTILYTVNLVNNGNTQLNNVVFTDSIPNGTSFVPGSVIIGNTANTTANPANGIPLGNFAVGQTTQIRWNVIINTMPNPNPIPNSGSINYTYTPGPGQPDVPGGTNTNTVNTNVANAVPGAQVVKAVDKETAAVGETLTYVTQFTNTGNVTLTGVVLQDTLPNGVTLVPNTTQLNGNAVTDNIQTGVNVGTLPVGATANVQFKVVITTIPVPNPIPNTSQLIYKFSPGPGQSPLTGTIDSNQVNTNVFQGINPNLVINKQVSQTNANIGDTLTYTLGVTNAGNVPLTNIIVKDTIPNGTRLVPGSTQLNFAPVATGDIQSGITIPSLPQDGVAVITFQVVVTQLPIPNPIPNLANANYNYVDVNGNTQTKNTTSNIVNTLIAIPQPSATIQKLNDKTIAEVGDVINYSVKVTNTGTVLLDLPTFQDTIPNGTSFVPGSVSVNGVSLPNANPATPFTIPAIGVGQADVITFKVLITTVPNPNPIPNSASVDYKYTTNASIPNGNTGNLTSNIVNTQVVQVKMNLVKSVDKTTANVGDNITYTLVATNPSQVPLQNVVITDTIPNGTQLVTNSVTVNGVARGGSPETGISVGTIGANSSATITFQVTITTTPNPNPIPNVAVANYVYQPDPTSPAKPGGTNSNLVNTNVGPSGTGSASINKAVDKTTANVGEQINYTIVVANTGTLTLTNVVFTDTLQATGITIVPNSTTVNGAANSGNVQTGIALPNIPVGGSVTITYAVIANTIPTPNPIPNSSKVDYVYTPNGGSPTPGNNSSNTVNTLINQPGTGSSSIVKSVDKTTANVGDTLNYSVVVTNTGTLALTNVVFTDTLQATGVSIVPNSTTVNGAANAGDIQTGIALPNIPVGGSVTINYQVKVNAVPTPNPIPNASKADYVYTPNGGSPTNGTNTSNTVNTNVTQPGTGSASIVKSVDKTTANVGDTLNYSVVVTNTGTLALTNVIFTDTLQATGISIVPNSTTVNGAANAGDIQTGIALPNIPVGGSVTINYQVKVNAVPTPNPIPNGSKVDYVYTPNGGSPTNGTNTSNTVNTNVNQPGTGSASIVKSVDKTSAQVGNTLNYSVVVTNTGTLALTNVVFTDTLQATGISIVPNSTTVNGVQTGGDITNGIAIPNIPVGGSATINYQVNINALPVPNPIPNASKVDYIYTPIGGSPTPGTNASNTVNTNVTQPGTGSASITKSVDKTSAQVGDIITYNSVITNTGTLPLTNVNFTDSLQSSNVSFVSGSLIVNGVSTPGSPVNGVAVPNIPVGGTVNVQFQVRINAMPTPNPIPNTSNVAYTYTPNGGVPTNGNNNSNTVNTVVNQPGQGNASIVKSVDKTLANVGDTLNYSIVVTNSGSLPLTNVIFTDTLQATNVSIVPNSTTINGASTTGDVQTGVPLPNLPVGGSATINYQVKVNAVPVPNPIPNGSNVAYVYTPNGGNPTNGTNNSNTVTTQVNTTPTPAQATVTKVVDKTTASIGNTLNYVITVTNTGSLTLTNMIFTDTLQSTNTSIVPNSTAVNGSPVAGSVLTGIPIPSLAAGQSAIVSFQVVINGVPVPNPIPNVAKVDYSYTPPGGSPTPGTNSSNTVTTNVTTTPPPASATVTKVVDKTTAVVGDTLNYVITVANNGSLPLTNVVFTDTLQATNVSIVPGTTYVNGIPSIGDITTGVPLPNLAVGSTQVISYAVKVNGVPVPNPIPNSAKVNYVYTPPGGSPTPGTNDSNTVNTNVNTTPGPGSASVVKAVDKTAANVGDTLNYGITVTNNGSLPLTNVIFTDTLQATNISIVPNSTTVNGLPVSGDIQTGIPLPNLPVGGTALISYQVKVNGVPVPNPIPNSAKVNYVYTPTGGSPTNGTNDSNTVNTNVNTTPGPGSASVAKAVDKTAANVGDTLNYGITVTNNGSLPLTNVIFTDTLQATNISIVPNSTTVNGLPVSGDIQTGIPLPNLPVGGTALISYQVKVNGVPVPNPIPNSAKVNYVYTPAGGSPTNGTNDSNTVNTNVNTTPTQQPITAITKQVDKTVSDIGEVLTYTLTATNTGTVTANNLIITDTVPTDTTFIPNSVTINGASTAGQNPAIGVNVGNLAPGQTVILTYKVQLVNGRLPNPNPVPNSAGLTYNYIPTGQTTPTNVNLTSNTVNTKVNAAIIPPGTPGTANPGVIKSVDKTVAQVGDTLTYTINVTNSGNISTNSTTLIDTIPNGTSFVQGSVTVGGTSQPSANPQTGINVGPVAPGATVVVKFQVTITTTPNPNPIPNVAVVNYTYTPDPTNPSNVVSKSSPSNEVNTTVGSVPINPTNGAIKTVDNAYAKVGDTLTYTVKVSNTGTVSATNIIFKDPPPQGTTFIANSVAVDGVPVGGVDPSAGFQIGNLAPGQTRIVTFKVTVTAVPVQNPMQNIAQINYNYTIDPTKPPINVTVPTNPATTQVNQAKINNNDGGIVKVVDKAFAAIGDILNYGVTLTNTGNVNANNVILKDIIPNGTSFVQGSVTVNGVQGATFDPNAGIPIGTIAPGQIVLVNFQVKVTIMPNPNPIPNTANVTYNYTVNPANPNGATDSNNSNTVTTKVNQGIIDPNNGGIVKSVDKTFAVVGDTLTYTVVLKNSGNVPVQNVIFKDTIPGGTSYVQNTFTLNGGIIPSANPGNGVNIGAINPGGTATVQFKVTVTDGNVQNPIPNTSNVQYQYVVNPTTGQTTNGGANSNTVNTTINQAIIDPNKGDLVKTVDKAYAQIGDVLNYTVKIRNSGNVNAESVVFHDTIPNGTSFVQNSVTVDNVSKPNQSPSSGVTIGTITPGQTVMVAFKVTVITMPNPNPIPNSGAVDYSYLVDPSTGNYKNASANSNVVNTKVNEAIIDPNNGGIVKAVDKAYAKVSDVLTYTITVKNTGNVSANNVIIVDTIANGLSFVPNSVLVNGVPINGATPSGIPVGVIQPGQAAQIQFKVTVISVPNPNPVSNSAEVNFKYTVDPANPNGASGSKTSNVVKTTINSANINPSDGGLVKSVDKAYAQVGDILNYTVNLRNTGNVNADNVIMVDTVPNGTTFVQGSVTVNGQSLPNADPSQGVQVGTIVPSGNVRIIYAVKVVSMPNPNPIPNVANVSYQFIVDPQAPTPQTVNNRSNQVLTKINSPNIIPGNGSVLKAVDKTYAKVGETITYTISVTNKGNVPASNVIIIDTIPEGTTFVDNSVTVNGATQVGVNPGLGVPVSDILPGNTTVLTYKVLITSIPKINPIPNTAEIDYTFTEDPNKPNGQSNKVKTNTVLTTVNSADISNKTGGLVKSVDKQYADVGDIITYTVNLTNNGNVPANNVMFYDTIPTGTDFVQGSLRVNGVDRGENPQNGALIGTIVPGETVVVSFKVKATQLLNPNVVNNQAQVSYTFTKDPSNPNGEKANNGSNVVSTVINTANISNADGGLIKTVNKEYASIGDELLYTITLKNTGNVAAENVMLVDTIPNGTQFEQGSVLLNGVVQTGANPANGVNVGLLPAGAKAVVQYTVLVTSMPNPNPIPNAANVSYRYLVNPANGTYNNKNNKSNTVLTKINAADINPANGGVVKAVDKGYADLSDILTYTVTLHNGGNVPAVNVLVKDTIPANTTFIPNSVTLNGIVNVGANPQNGVTIDSIGPGATVVMTFKVRVDTIPNPNVVNNQANVKYSFVVNPNSQQEVTKNVASNIVPTTINSGNISPTNGGIVKAVDKAYASIGETLTYTITVKNTGNVNVQNVIVQDTVPEGTTFINRSILVNGVQRAGDNLASGINIGTLAPEEKIVISYGVKVTQIPVTNPIQNTAAVNYTYTVDPNNPNGVNKTAISNIVYTKVNFADISNATGGIIKSVDKAYTDLGEQLTYTVILTNKGNVNANNIVLIDTIPPGTGFVANSVTVNGNGILGANPQTGINVGILPPNGKAAVVFKVIATTIPVGNVINNQAIVNYTYTEDPNYPNGVAKTDNSNVVQTVVRTGVIVPGTIPIGPDGKPLPPVGGLIKSENTDYAIIGDTITYSFSVTNSGNVSINNVVLTDIVPQELQFVPGSVSIDGVITPNANANTGVTIGTINANATRSVNFKAIVMSIPTNNPIRNIGSVAYQYTVDPSKPPVNKTSTSNEVYLNVSGARINPSDGGLIKQVDKTFAELGDTLTYTVILKNTGNVKANNVVVRDTIPVGTQFIPGTVTVNGNTENTLNPQTGVGILVLNPGATAVVSFKVKVIALNPNYKIINNAVVNYDFVANPNNPPVSSGSISNDVVTTENSVNFGGVNFTKKASTNYASLGDTVVYTFKATNTGNIMATNVSFQDTIPNGLQFVQGSVMINGASFQSADPQVGLSLGSIAVNQTTTLSFNVLVVTIPASGVADNVAILKYASQVNPNGNPVIATVPSNHEIVNIKSPQIAVTKAVDKMNAVVGDTLTYTINVQNSGNTPAIDAKISDSLPSELKFVPGSITINGVSSQSDNISSGVLIPQIAVGAKYVITFKAVIVGRPTNGVIKNTAIANYNYITDPKMGPVGGKVTSNPISVSVETASIKVTKTSDIKMAKIDDIITYTVTLENTGTIDALNTVFFDSLPNTVSFIDGSFKVNGVVINSVDLSKGVNLGNIPVGAKLIVNYSVLLNSVNACRKIINDAYAEFEYQMKTNSYISKKTTNIAEYTVIGQSPNFRQMNIDGIIRLEPHMPPIEEVNDVKAEIEITNYYVIDTMIGKSPENSKLTGQKLVVSGYIHETIEYTALEERQSAHYTCRTKKFSTFIVIQESSTLGAGIYADSLIEDVSFKQLNCRELYTNITFNLEATINN